MIPYFLTGDHKIIRSVKKVRAQVQQYGMIRCWFRLRYELKRRHGFLKKKFPLWQWDDRPLPQWLRDSALSSSADYRQLRQERKERFFFKPGAFPNIPHCWAAQVIEEADAVLAGRFKYFSCKIGDLGQTPDWLLNPFTGSRTTADQHWCDRQDFEANFGDIKYIWEPSRFCWAYALVRAYAATGDEKYPQSFWRLLESWMEANPPQMGPNWQCGQEIAIRVMACTFALYAFWRSPSTTDQRVAQIGVLLAGSAERIAGNIQFARSQMGNHATTEAAGLYTIGMLFPEFSEAKRWRKLAHRVLEDEARQFNWSDGSYTQHSFNYQRLMLHAYLWAFRLGDLNSDSFSDSCRESVRRSYQFLYQLQDPWTGRLPNYGPNDGAMMLPLQECDFLDYRPILEAMHYLMTGRRLYEKGAWQENLLWLFGPDAVDSPIEPLNRTKGEFPVGGYYVLRGKESWAMVRCHSYFSRPNQADMLHLDLWWRGLNVLRDSGTFTYFDPQDNWNQYFLGAAAHNTVKLGKTEQMIKGPRFQWHSQLKSRFLGRVAHEDGELWQGEHYGYQRLSSHGTHRRTVFHRGDQFWCIVDDILGRGNETAELFWQLPDVPYCVDKNAVILRTEQGEIQLAVLTEMEIALRVERGVENEDRLGWQSQYYGLRTPAPTTHTILSGELPLRFVTCVSLGRVCKITLCADSKITWRDEDEGEGQIDLFPPDKNTPVIRSVQYGLGNPWAVHSPLC
jgi:hypothetical protein